MSEAHIDTPAWQQVTPITETAYKVDIDAPGGAQIRYTTDGMAVYMLHREPGIYLNDHNKRVPEQIAAEAGFDVERWGRARRRNEAQRKAMQAIDEEFLTSTRRRVVVEEGEYRVVEIEPGYCNLEFDDGTVLNARGPVSMEVAMRRFQELTGVSTEPEASQPAEDAVEKSASKRVR